MACCFCPPICLQRIFPAFLFSLLIALMALSGCGKGTNDDRINDILPEAPVITSPLEGEKIRSPVTISGTGLAEAEIRIFVMTESEEIGTAHAHADPDGKFSIETEYTDPSPGTVIIISVIQIFKSEESEPAIIELIQAPAGNRYETASQAPIYHGAGYSNMQIFDVHNEEYLDLTALMEALENSRIVYFGEQHESAPIHELQLFILDLLTAHFDNYALAMEHFQAQNQSVLDDYLEDRITLNELKTRGDAWDNFERYWLPLVDHMKAKGLPVIATNVPRPALQSIYANGLTSPLDFFNSWDSSSPYDAYIPPRPLPPWTDSFQAYFETGFVYSHHGQGWGLSYEEALDYFTDLAYIRDHTMGYWTAGHLDTREDVRIYFVGGDWHVRTGIATPDIAGHWHEKALYYALITTSTRPQFDDLRTAVFEDRLYADYILIYD